jgi:hypothetical protein
MKDSRLLLSCLCAAIVAGGALHSTAADVRLGLVAYWRMDSTDGVSMQDETHSNNDLNMINMNAGNLVPGQFENAASFNGSSSYMLNLHSADPSLSGLPIYNHGSYTICMWVKGPAQTARYLYAEGNAPTPTPNPLLILQTGQDAANNSKLDVIIRNDAGTTPVNHRVSSTVVFDNTWHHIAWVDDNGTVRLYVDGVLDPAIFTYTRSGTSTLTTSALGALVRNNVVGYFNGQIDDIALWRRALTEAEVNQVRLESIEVPIPLFPAIVIVEPQGSTNLVGDRITLFAAADGAPPIFYQWLKNGEVIAGATSNTLTLANVIPDDSGDYSLRVGNVHGTNTSSAATVLVVPDPAPALDQGIVSYWPLDDQLEDDQARATMDDLYGNADFKVVADQIFLDMNPGVQGNAATFNGLEQYAFREGGFPIYLLPSYSVAMWIRGDGTNQIDRKIFSETSTNNANATFSIGTATGTNGTLRILVRDASGLPLLDRHSTRAPLDGNWHHVAWTDQNGQGRLYIDGILDETGFFYTRSAVTLDTTTLGAALNASGSNSFFAGTIDEIGAWSRAISLTEIQTVLDTGIPAPTAQAAPVITLQPQSQSVFTRANVILQFAASGTGPLFYQWRKGGSDLAGETNGALVLNNVTLGNAGNFDVVVTNAVGSVTSQVATLSVALRPITTDLKLDFNNLGIDDSPANTEPGFSSFTLPIAAGAGPFTRIYGGAEVILSGVSLNLQSRRRPLPTNMASFTEERLLQDFVFTPDNAAGQGLDLRIRYLQPNQVYTLTIWSYDQVNNDRFSDWTANGATVRNGYELDGGVAPTDNATHRITAQVTSDAQGTILIQGRRGSTATLANNVFLNAIRLETTGGPGEVTIRQINVSSPPAVRIVFDASNPAGTFRVIEKVLVDDADWTDVAGAAITPLGGTTFEATFPVPATNTRFYRIAQDP